MEQKVQLLQKQVEAAESQLRTLKAELRQAEREVKAARQVQQEDAGFLAVESSGRDSGGISHAHTQPSAPKKIRSDEPLSGRLTQRFSDTTWPLTDDEYTRYGRQLIMPEIGIHGQMRLKKARVLIVGVGGLGCPAAAYLAGAGVGTLGLMDGDTVELSNLHRQIAHTADRVGMKKVDSACAYVQSLNLFVDVKRHDSHLSCQTAIPIFEQYDLILDCTDHPTSRYLISDTCVLTGKALVSASALKTEGQLIVLNNPPRPPADASGGPCYRCIFPKPPPPDSVLSCGEGGILGPVVGVMGVMQALEAVKVLTKSSPIDTYGTRLPNGVTTETELVKPTLLMFSGFSNPQFRTVRLRSRRRACAACSANATITKQSLTSGSLDYIAFCGVTTTVHALPSDHRVSARDFAKLPRDDSNLLIDVRDKTQFAIGSLQGSLNVPWTGDSQSWLRNAQQSGALSEDWKTRYVVCRFGNDSQLAAKAMMDRGGGPVYDLSGGLKAWREDVDLTWPNY